PRDDFMNAVGRPGQEQPLPRLRLIIVGEIVENVSIDGLERIDQVNADEADVGLAAIVVLQFLDGRRIAAAEIAARIEELNDVDLAQKIAVLKHLAATLTQAKPADR